MSYSNPDRRMFSFGTFDFGGGADETFSIIGPKGKACRLFDYGVFGVTEVFAAGTNTPRMMVGSPSDDDAYGDEFDFGALADNHGKSIRSTYGPYDATNLALYLLTAGQTIAADAEVVVKCVAGTGSGLTGMAIPFVILDYDW